MKVLATGANGFIGKNLVVKLKELNKYDVITIDKANSKDELFKGAIEADFIFHLAGINRPKNEYEFFEGNSGLTKDIVSVLRENNKNTPTLITSSIQAELDNAYGKSKRIAEEELIKYSKETKANVFIYRLPNVFGKWCKPNYNSAVATFCYNIARGKEIWIPDSNKEMTLVYIDDVVRCLINTMEEVNIDFDKNNLEYKIVNKKWQSNSRKFDVKENTEKNVCKFISVDLEYKATLGHIVELLKVFYKSRSNLEIPDMGDEFTKKLYSTYLSYLPKDMFSYPLKMNTDNRGSFTEFIKTSDKGQVSINISKPGITKGNHYHHTKNEKFLVVSGQGIIQFRDIYDEEVIEYKVNGEELTVIDIPVGYTHNIINTGENDMVTVMWVNEVFNQKKPDTIFMEV